MPVAFCETLHWLSAITDARHVHVRHSAESPVGDSNNGVLFTCKRKKRQNFSENKKKDEAGRMFFLLHDFIAVVGEGRL